MATPLLTTKFYIPPPGLSHVSRSRLIERLNAGLDGRLTLVSAPAGFGKTTLLSEWVSGCGRPVAWLSLEPADNDPARFLAYVAAALRRIAPHLGEDLAEALASPQPPPLESLLTNLINEIAARPDPIVLVLDDYHAIREPQINQGLLFVVENMPPGLHLVLATRADPPWPLARLRAQGQVNELRSRDLRFTPAETTSFLNDVMGLDLTPDSVASLDSRTEGWIAGLQMAALSVRRHEDSQSFIQAFTGSHRYVLDFLVEEVLDQQPPELLTFLLKTSILERLSGPLCDALAGDGDGDGSDRLAFLERENLFLVPLDDERHWYRYHRLFADLLRSRLQDEFPADVPDLHQRASLWFRANGLIPEAIDHALAGGSPAQAIELIEVHALEMLIAGKLTTLSNWLEELPQDALQDRPWLCVVHAWTRYWTGRREEVEPCLQAAETALNQEDSDTQVDLSGEDRRRITGTIATVRAFQAISASQVQEVIKQAQKAMALVPDGEYIHLLAAIALGYGHWVSGRVEAAKDAYREAGENAAARGFRSLASSSYAYLGLQMVKQGRLVEAYQTYQDGLEVASRADGHPLPAAGFLLIKQGDLHREWNDLAQAEEYLAQGEQLTRYWGHPDILGEMLIMMARQRLAQGDFPAVFDYLGEFETLARRVQLDPFLLTWFADCQVQVWLSQGDLDRAITWVQSGGLSWEDDLRYLDDLQPRVLARVLVARGLTQPGGPYLDQAQALLARIEAAAVEAGWVQEQIQAVVMRAVVHQARSEPREAQKAITAALELAEPGGFVRLFLQEGEPVMDVLAVCRPQLTQASLRAYATRLLEARQSQSGSPPWAPKPGDRPGASERLVEPLSDRELQVLRLLASPLTSPEIAQELYIATSTVRTHTKNIYSKLNVHRRAEAVQRARELGLL